MANVTGSVTPIVALDYPDARAALAMVDTLGETCRFYKVGNELFTAAGASIVTALSDRGVGVFLDLKFHDIPNTVRGAVKSAAALGARLVTVHASGGRVMLEAAAEGAGIGCQVVAVTILTSMDEPALSVAWGRGVGDIVAEVVRLAELAADSGVHGVVCSGQEASAVRSSVGDRLFTLVPGVRLAGGDRHDQSRVVTPREAAEAGARYIVVGRAVTASESPRTAMKQVLSDLP